MQQEQQRINLAQRRQIREIQILVEEGASLMIAKRPWSRSIEKGERRALYAVGNGKGKQNCQEGLCLALDRLHAG